jgi:hypothetical protein
MGHLMKNFYAKLMNDNQSANNSTDAKSKRPSFTIFKREYWNNTKKSEKHTIYLKTHTLTSTQINLKNT